MNIKSLEESTYLFKGKVLVIDPCYPLGDFKDNFWSKFVDEMFDKSGGCLTTNGKLYELDGIPVYVHSTAYGDGRYPVICTEDNEVKGNCGVDAGCLSIIPLELAEKLGFEDYHLGVIIKGGFTETLGDGNFKCGDYEIITDGDYDEEEDEYQGFCEEEDEEEDNE